MIQHCLLRDGSCPETPTNINSDIDQHDTILDIYFADGLLLGMDAQGCVLKNGESLNYICCWQNIAKVIRECSWETIDAAMEKAKRENIILLTAIELLLGLPSNYWQKPIPWEIKSL